MKKYCVIGYPVGHSLSPKIHNAWFKKQKFSAHYSAIEVRPAELGKFMKRFRKEFSGGNVTIPHKEKVMRYVDNVSPEALTIGAVNTIVNRRGKLFGYNTDIYGAIEALRKNGVKSLRGKKMIVLGAGGASRAVIYGLKKAGAHVTILNRTLLNAKKLAHTFSTEYGTIKNFQKHLPCDVIINTTSVGMKHHMEKMTPLPQLQKNLKLFKKKPTVMDIIYRPHITKLLRHAKEAGCKIITGDHMFLAQAKKFFYLQTLIYP